MSWKCSCGVVNPDFGVNCSACRTPKASVRTPPGLQIPNEAARATHTGTTSRRKSTDWIWPEITDLQSATGAARQGFWAAMAVAIITAAVAVLAHAGFQILDFNLEALVDAGLFAIIAWGIHRMSRTAAIGGLGLYLIERIHMWSTYGPKGLVLTIIFTLMFINSIRGTFQYHKMIHSRLVVRNVIILNVLGLLYSLVVCAILFVGLIIVSIIGVDIEAINDTLLGFVMLSVMSLVYSLTLMRFMPFTKERKIFV